SWGSRRSYRKRPAALNGSWSASRWSGTPWSGSMRRSACRRGSRRRRGAPAPPSMWMAPRWAMRRAAAGRRCWSSISPSRTCGARVGGAAVTEEVFPGFKFSMFSYVVSLLRPEIIRDLDLPGHGLHILPLESTLTPMENGDYLAAWADHDETRRELYRHSPRDADAYDEYGRLMHFMAHAVKPIIGMVPPDPTSLSPRALFGLLRLGKHFRGLGAEKPPALVKLMTMSSADLLDEWFETDVLKATKSASGIIGTFLGPRSPGTAYVLLHHYMGELDGVFRAWGFAKGGTGSVSEAIAGAARR